MSLALVLMLGLVELLIGLFFIGMVGLRLWHMADVGAVIGYVTGVVVSTGPINAPFFLAYGLVRGAYLGTEAMGSLTVYGAKALTFRAFDALPLATLTRGLVIGASLMAGAFIAKRLVLRIDATRFDLLMDALLLVAGLSMLGSAVQTVAS